jgi:hypothetical protein
MTDKFEADLRSALISQYHAALEMLRQTVAQCPDSLWLSTTLRNQFWRVAYHALFYTHMYVQPTHTDFVRWPKHRDEVESTPEVERPNAAPYHQQDILDYLEFCVAEVQTRVAKMDFTADSGFPWYQCNKLEMQIISIRHLQLHAGELSEQLSDKTGIEIKWVGTKHPRSLAHNDRMPV